ncbi:MAG: hypothetical protein HQ542_09280 [Bacteroidia bacterium]|nr:hypothetical protein [Bacteroidia bacterium]
MVSDNSSYAVITISNHRTAFMLFSDKFKRVVKENLNPVHSNFQILSYFKPIPPMHIPGSPDSITVNSDLRKSIKSIGLKKKLSSAINKIQSNFNSTGVDKISVGYSKTGTVVFPIKNPFPSEFTVFFQ